MPESTAIFSVEAAAQVYNQTNELVYLGGNINHNANLSIEVGAYTTHGAASGSIPWKCTTERALPRAQNTDAQSQGTRDNAVRLRMSSPRAYHCDTLHRAHHIPDSLH